MAAEIDVGSGNVQKNTEESSSTTIEGKEFSYQGNARWWHMIPIMIFTMGSLMTVIPYLADFLDRFWDGDQPRVFISSGVADCINNFLAFIVGPYLGRISDATGRRWILMLSTVTLVLPYAALGVGLSGWWYLGLRAFSGMFAVNIAIAQAYISDVSPKDLRAARFGYALAVMLLAIIVGAMTGALVDWKYVRWVTPSCVILLVIYNMMLPESLVPENRIPLEKAVKYRNPITQTHVLRTGGATGWLTVMLCFVGFADAGVQATQYLYLANTFDWTPMEIGRWTAIGGTASAIYSSLMKFVVRRYSERLVVLVSLILTFISMILYGLADEGHWMYPIVIIASIRYLIQPASAAIMSKEVGPDRQGTVLAAASACKDLASAFGPLVFGFFSGAFSGDYLGLQSAHFYLAAVFYFFGTCCVVFKTKTSYKNENKPLLQNVA